MLFLPENANIAGFNGSKGRCSFIVTKNVESGKQIEAGETILVIETGVFKSAELYEIFKLFHNNNRKLVIYNTFSISSTIYILFLHITVHIPPQFRYTGGKARAPVGR